MRTIPSLAAACLAIAALVAVWPAPGRWSRRALLVSHGADGPGRGRLRLRSPLPRIGGSPVRAALFAAGVAAGAGVALGGPVAAFAAAAYVALAVQGWARRGRAREAATQRARRLDELCALAADLRAGLPPPVAPAASIAFASAAGPSSTVPVGPGDRLAELTSAACRLAEQTGAPLADLLERIECDARAADRLAAGAVAQAAGARATAMLLAGLPAAGIGIGYGMGVDPLGVLLDTPLGALCAVAAIVLQIAGLMWSARLTRIERPA